MKRILDSKEFKIIRKTLNGWEDIGVLQHCTSCDPSMHSGKVMRLYAAGDPSYIKLACNNRDCPNFNNPNPIHLSNSMEETKNV